jgi:hypothetical protein
MSTSTLPPGLPRWSTIPAPAAQPEPTTVEVVRPERTIMRDVDKALPIALSGTASPATVESRLPAGCSCQAALFLAGRSERPHRTIAHARSGRTLSRNPARGVEWPVSWPIQ